jgi:hypothetical protein
MERLGKFAEARTEVLADVKRLVATVQRVAATPFSSVEDGIAVLKELRTEASEDLNQIQHEFMIVCAAEWLISQKRCPSDTLRSWNPRQTGPANEPDLRDELNGEIVVSAEITTSTKPQGVIDSRMRQTLEKLSRMAGQRFYFAASSTMCQRSSTKITKAGWKMKAVHLSGAASAL